MKSPTEGGRERSPRFCRGRNRKAQHDIKVRASRHKGCAYLIQGTRMRIIPGISRFARNDRFLLNVILVTVCWTRRDRLGKRE